MGKYVILNFEDKITDTQKGAADSTILGLKQRYEVRKQPTGLARKFLGTNSVAEQRCVEAGPPIRFTDDTTRLSSLKAACAGAAKVYLVAHGDPRQTDLCFTNNVGSTSGVVQLATAKQFAAFLARILPAASDELRVALVMCYGARCRDYQSAHVDHMGMIPHSDLVTSFAYRLFHALAADHAIRVQLSAVTGKIQHDSTTGRAMVEHEDVIDVNMEIAEADKAKRASMIGAVGELKPQNQQDDTYKANYKAWKDSSAGKAATDRASAARGDRDAILKSMSEAKKPQREMMPKYGKLVYRLKGSSLTILSKYGDPGNKAMKPATVLYAGPLLPAG